MLRLSPTAISRYDACNRAWRYSRDIRAPQKKSAALGVRIEDVCNRYALGEGFTLSSKESRIVFPALKFIPTPVPKAALQSECLYPGPPGVNYFGKMDLRLPPTIYDFKSTQDIDEWALNDETFPNNIQRVIYADSLEDDIVTTTWIYMQTAGPKRAERVTLTEPRTRVHERRVELIDPLAIAMVATVGDPPLSFSRNLSQCGAYGGCPYKVQCYADQPPTLTEQIAGSAMASPMLERLRAKQNASAAAQSEPAGPDLSGPAEEPKTEEPAPVTTVRMPPLKRTPPARGNHQEPVAGEIDLEKPIVPELGGFVQSLLEAAMDAADIGEDYKAQSLVVAAAVMRKRGAA